MNNRASLSIHAEINRDGSAIWIAHGTAGGVPYIAESDSEEGARAAACELVYQRHAARTLAQREGLDLARKTFARNYRNRR